MSADLFGLAGRVAVVTGGGQGLGRGICEAFASVGARVAVLDIDADLAEDVARSLPTESIGIGVDVRRKAELDDATADVLRRLGAPRAWVNNVGGLAGIAAGPTIELAAATSAASPASRPGPPSSSRQPISNGCSSSTSRARCSPARAPSPRWPPPARAVRS
jgi:NAD(P)-dependent dehydrogenase (short-subunit alcohol dehydrogenase family)